VYNAGASNGGQSLCIQIFRYQGNGATPRQYIDTTRQAIDCATTLLLTVFGRQFVKRFALCYLSVVCLSVLSACNVGALWSNGWMDQDETWHAGSPRPWPHCVRWGPTSSPPNGHSPQFSAHICCGQMAAWIKMPLGMEVGLSPGDFVLDGDPVPPPQKGGRAPLQIFGPCLLWPNGWMNQDGERHGERAQPNQLCVRWGPSPLPKKGQSPLPNFRLISTVAKRLNV